MRPDERVYVCLPVQLHSGFGHDLVVNGLPLLLIAVLGGKANQEEVSEA